MTAKKKDAQPKTPIMLLIMEVLKKYSDPQHPLTQKKIIDLINSDYEPITGRRQTIAENIKRLKEVLNAPIERMNGKEPGYYWALRDIADADLRIPADSVLFSKNLTKKQAERIISELCSIGSISLRERMQKLLSNSTFFRTENTQITNNIENIITAIEQGKQISFHYYSYGTDKKLHPVRNEEYIVNPYQLVHNNGRYYLMGNYDKYDNLSNYRIDKMMQVTVLSTPIKSINKLKDCPMDYTFSSYIADHIYMLSGRHAHSKLAIDKWMINDLVDWFGDKFTIVNETEDKYHVRLRCNRESLICWAMQYGRYVEILEPVELRQEMQTISNDMAAKYNKPI